MHVESIKALVPSSQSKVLRLRSPACGKTEQDQGKWGGHHMTREAVLLPRNLGVFGGIPALSNGSTEGICQHCPREWGTFRAVGRVMEPTGTAAHAGQLGEATRGQAPEASVCWAWRITVHHAPRAGADSRGRPSLPGEGTPPGGQSGSARPRPCHPLGRALGVFTASSSSPLRASSVLAAGPAFRGFSALLRGCTAHSRHLQASGQSRVAA